MSQPPTQYRWPSTQIANSSSAVLPDIEAVHVRACSNVPQAQSPRPQAKAPLYELYVYNPPARLLHQSWGWTAASACAQPGAHERILQGLVSMWPSACTGSSNTFVWKPCGQAYVASLPDARHVPIYQSNSTRAHLIPHSTSFRLTDLIKLLANLPFPRHG